VTYSDEAALAIPLAAADDRSRHSWTSTVAAIDPGGSTNMASGLDLATQIIDRERAAGRVPRIILISDGMANAGDASLEGLTRRARQAAQGEYTLSSIGVGLDFNEELMTALADAGTGNYYFLQGSENLADVFAREFEAASSTVASALAVRVEPATGVEVVDAAGYPLEHDRTGIVFRPGSLFAGQERRVWLTLVVPHDHAGDLDLGRFSLSYGDGKERTTLTLADVPRVACVDHEDEYYSRFDAPAWSRSVTVDAYNKMQNDVARSVQTGQRVQALRSLNDFAASTQALNERMKSPEVAAQLKRADELRGEVDAAFAGDKQRERQNQLGKMKGAEALDARRAGSKQ
jgi:Ca-activated chloride channel family protein